MFVLISQSVTNFIKSLSWFLYVHCLQEFLKVKTPSLIFLSQSSIKGHALKIQTFPVSNELGHLLNLPSKLGHVFCTYAILQSSGAAGMVTA